MLVLGRSENEEIVIGGNIVVTVVGIGGGDVRLGITAPKDVSVHRREVQNKINQKNAEVADA